MLRINSLSLDQLLDIPLFAMWWLNLRHYRIKVANTSVYVSMFAEDIHVIIKLLDKNCKGTKDKNIYTQCLGR